MSFTRGGFSMRGTKFTFALMLGGLLLPAISLFALPQPGNEQFNHGPDGFFYSPGRSYLGVDIQDVTPERLSELKLKEERGVEVLTVDQDAPAGKAGLKEHDVILEFNGTKVEGVEHLRRMIREIPPGRTATVAVSRDGKPMLFKVQLADKGQAMRMSGSRKIMIPRPVIPEFDFPAVDVMVQTSGSRSGAVVENLTPQLGDFFGARNGEGVLVRSVEKGSAAEAAGLKAGDVIVRADNEKLSGRTDLSHVLRDHREGCTITLGIVREKHEQTVLFRSPARSNDSRRHVINSDEMDSAESTVIAIEDLIDNDVDPEIEKATEMAAIKLRSSAYQLRKELVKMKPAIEKALHDSKSELNRAFKVLQEEMKHNSMI